MTNVSSANPTSSSDSPPSTHLTGNQSSASGAAAPHQSLAPDPNARGKVWEFFSSLSLIVVAAIMLRGSVIEAFKIPSASMYPTLKIGDQLFVWKLAYGFRLPFVRKSLAVYGAPQRGDIVVFTREDDPITLENESDTNLIKRVIGLPGDKVEVRGSKVYINGEYLPETYARWEDGGSSEGNFGPETVPRNSLFVLGDNRDRSKDSRFWNGSHYLPIENVKGRAVIIYWSTDSLDRIGNILR